MNSGAGTHRVKTRFFASALSREHDTAPGHEVEEHMGDHERNEDNQDDGELYLTDDDGGDFNELAAETSSVASTDNSSFVYSEQGTITAVRVRPMLPSEKKGGYRVIVDVSVNSDGLMTRIVNPTALQPPYRGHASARCMSSNLPLMESISATDSANFPAQFTQEFWFDYSFWSCDRSSARQVATQSTIYDELGALALQTVLQGHNCSVFAYGQPGAGKTYTMMGSSGERTSLVASMRANSNVGIPSTLATSERRGLIPRICQGLVAEIDEAKRSGTSCTLVMSYVEIYDERVYDLLSQATTKVSCVRYLLPACGLPYARISPLCFIQKSLKVREHPEDGAFVERALRVQVTSYTQILDLIDEGNRARSVTSAHNTYRPTRSHTVLTVSLAQNSFGLEGPKKSKLSLVDLAGSERVDLSGASGLRLREAASVNRSLATLADVVGALAKRKRNSSVVGFQPQKAFVPYRNSVLTRLLKECLGGRAKTIMIGAISPCCAHYEESIATLRYIERARSVCSTIRSQGDPSGDTTHTFLGDANKLKSSLCAANEANFPSGMPNGGTPEHHDECMGCDSCCDDNPADTESLEAPCEVANSKCSEAAALKITVYEQERSLHEELTVNRANQAEPEGLVLRKSVHLLNLVAIRRRWQSLRQYRALEKWRKLVTLNASTKEKLPVKLELSNLDDRVERSYTPRKSVGRKAGCPPLHTRIATADSRAVGRVQDVVAAVVTTDAICCAVVQDFLFPRHPESPLLSMQHSNTSLLELLASSSEFDRSDFCFDLSGDYNSDEAQLEDLASPEGWPNVEEGELNPPPERGAFDLREGFDVEKNGVFSPLLSTEPRDEESSIHSTLSLCVDSIDMARRALGPGVCNLRSRFTTSGTGVECELLRYLDKRFIIMTRNFEDLMVAFRSRDANLRSMPSRSCCDALETMIGEFCLQIIARLCDQLPSVASACVAGRLQLETQLESFSDRLKRYLLPEIARGGGFDDNSNTAFAMATELLVMAERIKLVWNVAGHRKRERLLQAQTLQTTAIKDRKMAATIAALEGRNVELSAKCDALLATNSRLEALTSNVNRHERSSRVLRHDEALPVITLEQLEMEHDANANLARDDDDLGAKLAVEVARSRDVQARNDELLGRFAALSRSLAAASARMTALEVENSRLSSSLLSSTATLSGMHSASDVDKLQKELENAQSHALGLESQLTELKRFNQEQTYELESVNARLSCEKDDHSTAEVKLVQLRRQLDDRKHAEVQSRDAEATNSEGKWRRTNEALIEFQTKSAELSASFLQAEAELSCALETTCRAESENTRHIATIEDLKASLRKAQMQRESAEMLAEDSVTKYAALRVQVATKVVRVSALEELISQDKQRLLELEASLEVSVHERDEHILLLSQTEEALSSALDREKVLQSLLAGAPARESEEMNRVRGELHETTLELASLREELAELLDHSTLQSAAIESLTLEQADALRRAQELELERDELALRSQAEQVALEQKENEYQAFAQQCAEARSRLERQQEIERNESLTAHETLQRQTIAFQKLQARQHSIKMNYCSTIRDLKTQVETLSAESRALNKDLAAREGDMEAAITTAKAQLQEQTKLSILKQEKITCRLTGELQECRMDLKASTGRWVRAETQCGLLRVCTGHLKGYLSEVKEACRMQLADAESSQLRVGNPHILAQVTNETELSVSEHLSSLDAWFDEVISGDQVIREASSPADLAPENTIVSDNARGEDVAARSSLLRTLTDLSALTNELLVVCESASDSETRSNNSSAEKLDHALELHVAREDTSDLELELKGPHDAIPAENEAGEKQKTPKRKKKASGEVVQLRKIVMKLKEALDAKDDMLLFLDGKVRRLEQFASA
ncbi:hypothetical protein PHYPSEUDO_005829 [Phytophthora pseudosyringae]|uniref:Kinesin motor domain-containing protein n=1 Tax=Phytophthora pseudosyringae TaxID=221518 RepID=A0A8T1VN50_9STRA|nr:hypothetical protein PHYPSEUDO_005829 [Phytophthora pseudosyringae]